MKHGSLFSGIGGFDLAAEWMGWENVFHCEWNEFGQKILKHYWPNAISYTDITTTDFSIHREQIDILTGGFPCQPYSAAGKRLGKEDDRHLWPEMLRAIREIQPTYIVAENVRGLTNWNGGMVFDEVQADMESEGYQVTPFLLPACAVNAPHRRDRIWFVAYNPNARTQGLQKREKPIHGLRPIANTRCQRQAKRQEPPMGVNELCQEWNATDSKCGGLEECRGKTISKISNHYFQTGRPQTEPTLCRGDDGLSNWVDRIKALGNAIVPQVALEIFKAINKTLDVR